MHYRSSGCTVTPDGQKETIFDRQSGPSATVLALRPRVVVDADILQNLGSGLHAIGPELLSLACPKFQPIVLNV